MAQQAYPVTVLCVEDDEDILRLIQLSLDRIGSMRVHTCIDPRLALGMARELRPDLIVLDYKMPEIDGQELMLMLKADPQLADIPVMFLTASATPDVLEQLRKSGAAGIFTKPFDPKALALELTAAWFRATEVTGLPIQPLPLTP
jgi:CheY-like chemotaxis protein